MAEHNEYNGNFSGSQIDTLLTKIQSSQVFTTEEKTKLASLVNYDDTEIKEDISGIETSLNSHKSDTTNPHQVTKTQVGLGNVDNTSDANKPISTATQAALNDKVDKVTGKGLSTNDFTDSEKAQISANKAGIAAAVNSGAKNKLASTLDLAYLKSINNFGTWADNVYTFNSISFTVNVDGTVLVNGTPSVQTAFLLIGKTRLAKDIAAGNYTLSGCPSGGGSGSNYRVFAYNPSSTVGGATDVGNGVKVHCDYSHSKEANIAIVIGANKTVDALLFSPMLRDASIEDSTYQPYAPTNRELYEMILAMQSGS